MLKDNHNAVQRSNRSFWAGLLATDSSSWPLAARLAAAAALLMPPGATLSKVVDLCSPASPARLCMLQPVLQVAELLVVAVLLLGVLVRIVGPLAMGILTLQALSSLAGSGLQLGGLAALIRPTGDWAYAMGQLGAAALLWDVQTVGAGRWSLDHAASNVLRERDDACDVPVRPRNGGD